MTTAGLLCAYTRDGHPLWQRAMLAELGRLSFPNGRTGAPILDDDLVIMHIINGHWGKKEGPARDRFYAFDKLTGETVWGCTPGEGPKDSSFSAPVLEWRDGKRLLYAATGCGNMVCINVRTGDPIWRYKMSVGGVNSSALLYGDSLIAIHGKENIDSSAIGRMLSLQLGAEPPSGQPGPLLLDKSSENWRNDLVAFSSSPVLVGKRVYQTTFTGDLCSVDADSGKVLWRHKLASSQIHASPLYADGKLYVPMANGTFHIVRPADAGPEVLQSLQLEGSCLGQPALWNGRLFVHTTGGLYCFGSAARVARPMVSERNSTGPATRLQVVPQDVLRRQGEAVAFLVRSLDANGQVVDADLAGCTFTPPANLGVSVDANGVLTAAPGNRPGAGVMKVSHGEISGSARLRFVSTLPYLQDFEGIDLKQSAEGYNYAFPPSEWVGAKAKFEVIDLEGNQVLAKTIVNPLFQRATALLGTPDMSDYTMRVDIMSEGNRRTMSTAGVVNQRYLILLKGNHQELEISSNMERIKETVAFRWRPGIWYTLKTRVDVAADGSGVVRAKVWKRGEAEPESWSLEVPHHRAHQQGTPGLFGFALQVRFPVYLDNLAITPNHGAVR